ncbi:hypothetical protein Hanom_Chr13g01197801 [Helianthus anomalus]
MPTAKEKKKLRTKRKAVQSGVIPRNVRAKKGSASIPEVQCGKGEKHVATSKGPEAVKDKNIEVPEKKTGADDDVVITEVRLSTPPPPPSESQPIPQEAETSKPRKMVLPDPFEGFPNIQGEYKDDILLGEDFDMFHDATVKDLKKKVSILEKEKEKVEADRNDLKKQLEELVNVNEEIKIVIIKYAKKIKTLKGDVQYNTKLFDQLAMEITDFNLKNKSLNETNQTLHQMLSEIHEASASEVKVLKLEIEAHRADKTVKDEQLNMLYTIMEHHLGINVQSIYNNIEIQRVEERRAQREKELADIATQKKKQLIVERQGAGGSSSLADVEMVDVDVDQAQSFVLVGEASPLSYNFDDIIRRVQEKEEENIEDEELERILEDVDNYDPSWDNYEEDNDDQGSTGLLIVNPSVQQKMDDFLNDELNKQEEDQNHEFSSSGKKNVDQVFLTQPTVIYLNAPVEGGG